MEQVKYRKIIIINLEKTKYCKIKWIKWLLMITRTMIIVTKKWDTEI